MRKDPCTRRDLRVALTLEALRGTDVRCPPPLAQIAARVNLSASRLRHLFAQQTGTSVVHYLKERRLALAHDLLRNSFLLVKEVAAAVGINDVSHFSRDYKARYGQTPRQSRGRSAVRPNQARTGQIRQ